MRGGGGLRGGGIGVGGGGGENREGGGGTRLGGWHGGLGVLVWAGEGWAKRGGEMDWERVGRKRIMMRWR